MCSQKAKCSLCPQTQCYHMPKYCAYHAWNYLNCSRCNQRVDEIIHNLIFYYFHKRSTDKVDKKDGDEQVDHDVIDQELQQLDDQSLFYEVMNENFMARQVVYSQFPFLSRYQLAEEWRAALNVLLSYFSNHESELKDLKLEEFKKFTKEQLLNNFLKEVPNDELLFLIVPDSVKLVCIECVEKEQIEWVAEVRKKPQEQAIGPIQSMGNEQFQKQFLNDDELGVVFSFLEFPYDFNSISRTCKRFYQFLHYSSDFSWLSNFTFGRETHTLFTGRSDVEIQDLIRNAFRTYRGLTNLSSISKIFNISSMSLSQGLFFTKLFEENSVSNTCLDTLFMGDSYGYGSAYMTYYWMRKMRSSKNGPVKQISIRVNHECKTLIPLVILFNSERLMNNLGNNELLIHLIGPYSSLSMKFDLQSKDYLKITENGLPVKLANNLLESLNGDIGSSLQLITELGIFYMKDYFLLEKNPIRKGLVIKEVWVDSYIENYTQLLKNMQERGIIIHKIILHLDYLHKVTETENVELLSITNNIEICKYASMLSQPAAERWTLASVIQ